jgi:hypothetical protein
VPQIAKLAGTQDVGVLAQELSGTWAPAFSVGYLPGSGAAVDREVGSVNYGLLMPLVMAAIKDMSALVDEISAKNQ